MMQRVRCILSHVVAVELEFLLQCLGAGEVEGACQRGTLRWGPPSEVWLVRPWNESNRSRRQQM